MPSLNTVRENHACDTGNYGSQHGIFVTGGVLGDGGAVLSSVEFYVAQEQRWRVLGSMTTTRVYHSLSMVGGLPYSAGGGYPLPSALNNFSIFHHFSD